MRHTERPSDFVLEGTDVAVRLQNKGTVIVYQLRRKMLTDISVQCNTVTEFCLRKGQ